MNVKELSDKELLELEHDTQVDCIENLDGDLSNFELYEKIDEEIKFRDLTELPRLNTFS